MQFSVKTQKPYTVTVAEDFSLCQFNNEDFKNILIVTDDLVAPLYLEEVSRLFNGKRLIYKIIKHGEESKNLDNYLEILSLLTTSGFTRHDAVLALGGGVVGDLAGFAASTYMRGIKFYQIPTTLLSQIDSCVGGKTSIDFNNAKNVVGTFYQPTAVYVNTSLLKTLPEKEFENGLGELTKYAFLTGRKYGKTVTAQTIAECLEYKISIVCKDEYDQGGRALLNLGHTVGHAIEALSGFTISHGLCVYKGISAVLDISAKLYSFDRQKTERLRAFLQSFGLDGQCSFDKRSILEKIKSDKKAFSDGVNLVTVFDLGDCRVERISFERLGKLL